MRGPFQSRFPGLELVDSKDWPKIRTHLAQKPSNIHAIHHAATQVSPLMSMSLWTVLAPPAPSVHALEAGWVAVPPGWVGWAD
jgi:hypothetical protein